MSLLDPQRLQDLVPGLLGGAVTGLYHFSAIVMAGGSPAKADYIKLAVNMVMAILAGGIFAYFLTQLVVGMVPWTSFKDSSAIGFGIGLLGWELLPLFYILANNRAKQEADKLGGGQ